MAGPALHPPLPYRFTRHEYHRMAEAGLFADERVELLDGTIVTMGPHTTETASTVARLAIVLDDWSEPEPDAVVCKIDPYDYARHHPTPAEIVLICEVALTSLSYDRGD